jgi:predicted nucleic acid-binding protein
VTGCYIDTSALLKWYVHEAGSEAVEAFIRQAKDAVISRLTVVELRCALARRRRAGTIDSQAERQAYDTFTQDVALGHLRVVPVDETCFADALALIESLPAIALRTLDALHLAAARGAGCDMIATADRVMAEAGRELDVAIEFFGIA